MQVTARRAVPADLPLLTDLVEAGVAAARAQRGGDLWVLERAPHVPLSADWLTRLDSASTAVLAGCIDDVAVGVLLASRRALIDQRLLARIDLVFVDPEARDVGVGEALVHGAAGWAVASGCIGLDGLALPGDRQTKNLYERAGMTAREITVYRELAP